LVNPMNAETISILEDWKPKESNLKLKNKSSWKR
jgi:hypothetical protein